MMFQSSVLSLTHTAWFVSGHKNLGSLWLWLFVVTVCQISWDQK